MPVLESQIDTNSEEFQRNYEALKAAVDEFREIEQKVTDQAETKREKFEKRGQLLPHERVQRLLDPRSPFLTLLGLAGIGLALRRRRRG